MTASALPRNRTPCGRMHAPLPRALERAEDVQQVGVVALLGGRHAVVLEALEGVVGRVEAGAPALVAEGRIGDDVVEGLELAGGVLEERVGQRVALLDQRRGVVVQDHVHAGQAGGGGVLFLPVERDLDVFAVAGLVADLEQQRAGAAGGVVDGRVVAGLGAGGCRGSCAMMRLTSAGV